MVCEALAGLPAWRALPDGRPRDRCSPPRCCTTSPSPRARRTRPDGRITSRGHSRRGAILARQILWRLGVPFAVREQVCAPGPPPPGAVLPDRARRRRSGWRIEVSQTARCDHLALLAEADVRGRICADQQRLLDNVALFAEYLPRAGLPATSRWPFASDHARFLYFRDERPPPRRAGRTRTSAAEVVLMSGLPGVGQGPLDPRRTCPTGRWSRWTRSASELDVDPSDEQGDGGQPAREQAREHLRRRAVVRLERDQPEPAAARRVHPACLPATGAGAHRLRRGAAGGAVRGRTASGRRRCPER